MCRVVDSCVGVWLLQGCFDFEIDDGKGGRLSLTVEVRRSRQAHFIPVTHISLMCHSYSHALTPHVHTHMYTSWWHMLTFEMLLFKTFLFMKLVCIFEEKKQQ